MNIYNLKPANQNTRTARMSEIMDGVQKYLAPVISNWQNFKIPS